MQLEAFLKRIGYAGSLAPDAATLRAIHRSFVLAVPYENLDVQFGRPVTRHPAAAYSKIVDGRRGGWCYEMNGLLGWALEQAGFRVRRLAGAVTRETAGDSVIGNHLVLIIDLPDGPWLADAGYGDGLIEAVPLREGPFSNGIFLCALERIDGGWWRYHNDPRGSASSFDFHEGVTDEALLEDRCQFLQSDPGSSFVLNAVVQRWTPDAMLTLRGKVQKTITSHGTGSQALPDADAYVSALKDIFALDLPQACTLWPRIEERHRGLGLA
jgi:N-hydroxyarylamine O-acetyltransferase